MKKIKGQPVTEEMMNAHLLLIFSLLLALTNGSLLDLIRLQRKRRNYADCCTPTVTSCCTPEMMAAAPAQTDCCTATVSTCCPNSMPGADMAAVGGAMDEESRDMYNAWNAPVKLGVFINPEANQDDIGKGAKRTDTPFHPGGGSGSGSGESYFTSDSAKRDTVPKPKGKPDDSNKQVDIVKQENVKKTTIETNEKKSELNAKASEIEEVQGGQDKEKRQTTITCQGQKDWLQCPTYQLIKIKDAFWGRDDEKTCTRSHAERSLQTTKMCAQDESNTMTKLQNACDGESACELVASPIYFDRTDCPDVYKFLRVNWECAHSESRIKNK